MDAGDDDKYDRSLLANGENWDTTRSFTKLIISGQNLAKKNGEAKKEGEFDGKLAAVKKKSRSPNENDEALFYWTLDGCENIVRLYTVEKDKDGMYLAFERGLCDLRVHLESKTWFEYWCVEGVQWSYGDPSYMKLSRDVAFGVCQMHSKSVTHGNLSLANIIIFETEDLKARAKIIGFGDKSSRVSTVLTMDEMKEDLKNLGIIIYYCWYHGWDSKCKLIRDFLEGRNEHAMIPYRSCFQSPYTDECDENTEKLIWISPLLHDLLNLIREDKVNAEGICAHPLFWKAGVWVEFIEKAHEKIKVERGNINQTLISSLDIGTGEGWGHRLDGQVQAVLKNGKGLPKKKKKGKDWLYNPEKARKFVHALRDIFAHPSNVAGIPVIEGMPGGLGQWSLKKKCVKYFLKVIPDYFVFVYNTMNVHCNKDPNLKKFFVKEWPLQPES